MPKTAVLLSTYNGSRFLDEQLNSLFSQSEPFTLVCRDDGSSDETESILEIWAKKKPEILFLRDSTSKNLGVIASFDYLLQFAKSNTEASYFLFCDQDDIWDSKKIESAILGLTAIENIRGLDFPVLYHSDLELIDYKGESLHSTFWKRMELDPRKSKNLNYILCQPTITGCTAAFNRALADLVTHIPSDAKMHDWWLGLVACCFGEIVSDKNAYIKYRQHSGNVIGSTGLSLKRLVKHLSNLFQYRLEWKKQSQSRRHQGFGFLQTFESKLSENQVKVLYEFINTEKKGFWRRKFSQFRYGFWQHGWYRNLVSFLFF